MTTQLPALPAADLGRLSPVEPQALLLACLAFEARATAPTIARRLKPWGLAAAQAGPQLEALAQAGLAQTAGASWLATQAGEDEAARRFDTGADPDWPAFAATRFPALALGLDPAQSANRAYLSSARNLYAAVLARLFDLADPAAHPTLGAVRAALIWRIAAARCPDLLPADMPAKINSPNDTVTRALYVGFCGLSRGSVDQATPALLRRVLPWPVATGRAGLRRALVRAALRSGGADTGTPKSEVRQMQTAPTAEMAAPPADAPEDFAESVAVIARRLKTPKARGGYFGGGQVAIAQVYDAYAADREAQMTLDAFKAKLWAAVRAGAGFHLTRLDIPDLMEEALRKRSATPTRAGDVVHFVVVD